jgi:NAD(P)-dependent dehydrogenase (short-subunit alcohol dehydrogenase family)
VDHVLVTGPGPREGPLASYDVDAVRSDLDAHIVLPLQVARSASKAIRSGGTMLFMGCIDNDRSPAGRTLISAMTAALAVVTKGLAYELAPIRVNLLAAGFVDTPLAAERLGDQLESRREELRTGLPIRRVIGPTDVASLAVHLMTNTAVTGATFDIDGGQQVAG